MEKKAEIRKLPFCPASRREAGFFADGRVVRSCRAFFVSQADFTVSSVSDNCKLTE
mgnify:CR=1 FL=1